MKNRQIVFRLVTGLIVSSFVFAIINFLDLSRPEIVDGWSSHGLPFTFYQHGGFQHRHEYIFSGLLENLLITVAAGIAIGWFWNKISERRSKQM